MTCGMFVIREQRTPPGGFGDTVYRSAACPPGDAVHCGGQVKCDETSVVATKSRGYVTLTELVKAFPAVVVSGLRSGLADTQGCFRAR